MVRNTTKIDNVIESNGCKGTAKRKYKKRNSKVNVESLQKVYKSKLESNDFQIGQTRFVNKTTLYSTELDDYTIISDYSLNDKMIQCIPKALKPLLSDSWLYCLHVSHGMRPSVNRKLLQSRVTGGQILAYKYTECSIEGNDCVYYGFVPTTLNEKQRNDLLSSTHKKCRLSMLDVWPRKLYVYLSKVSKCDCTNDIDECSRFQIRVRNQQKTMVCCLKRIPWSQLYIMMGDLNENIIETFKVPRQCSVCAQCYECSQQPTYCRKHRICKHKISNLFDDLNSIATLTDSSIKNCNKV